MSVLFRMLPRTAFLAIGGVLFLLGLALFFWQLSQVMKRRRRTHRRQRQRSSTAPDSPDRVRMYACSILGSREYQQDCIWIPSEDQSDEHGLLAVLCDGMGGLEDGAQAAILCMQTLVEAFFKDRTAPDEFYRTQILNADARVADMHDKQGHIRHGGTTLVSVIVRKNNLYWASVGDSRIYIFRNDALEQLSRDHNYFMRLCEQVQKGEISEGDALSHPKKHALISYIGMGGVELIDIEKDGMQLNPGDRIMLCSDGLSNALTQEEMTDLFRHYATRPDELPKALTDASSAKTWMRHDNTSVIIISYGR